MDDDEMTPEALGGRTSASEPVELDVTIPQGALYTLATGSGGFAAAALWQNVPAQPAQSSAGTLSSQ